MTQSVTQVRSGTASRGSVGRGSAGRGSVSRGRRRSPARTRPRDRPLRGELIARTAHRLDQAEAQLRPEAPDTHVHDVGAGVKVVAPDGGEQLILAHGLARVLHELL